MVLLAQVADTPVGSPFAPETPALEIPVAPVVTMVIFVKAVPIQSVGLDDGVPAELFALTVIVPDAVTLVVQLPTRGIE